MKTARAAMLLIAISAPFMSAVALAQNSPMGLWRSVDDKTGEAKAEIRISESGGLINGKIEKRLAKGTDANALCTECKDDRKGKPMQGLEILRSAPKDPAQAGGSVWEGGKILDPESGREYTLRMTPIEGGKKLEVRGSIGPFGRTQTWVRAE